MIARTWTGIAHPGRGDDYLAHLETNVLPEIRRIPGHRGAYVLRQGSEFQVITFWDSMDAVAKFAPGDSEAAVVSSEARELLDRFDDRVRHFEVVHRAH